MNNFLKIFLFLVLGIGMISCEKSEVKETPKIIDSGLSFGPYSRNGGLIRTSIRIKYTNDERLRWIVEISPTKDTKDNREKFHDVVQLLLSETTGMGSSYKNKIKFDLKDKDGFVIQTISIFDSIYTKGNYIGRGDDELVEYTGNQKISKDLAIRIVDCDMHPEFTKELENLISAQNK